jgi:hypothetical protein
VKLLTLQAKHKEKKTKPDSQEEYPKDWRNEFQSIICMMKQISRLKGKSPGKSSQRAFYQYQSK